MKQDQPLEYLRINDLELWAEANVRNHRPMQDIDELAGNIRQNGLRFPLLVKKKKANGKYGVFSGQRRLTACAKAGLERIPRFVFDRIRLQQARILSLSENLHSLPFDSGDRARASKRLLRHFKDTAKVAAALGVDPADVKEYLGYDALPDEAKLLAASRKISPEMAAHVYSKFAGGRALEICRELAGIPAGDKKRRRGMAFAVGAAKSTDTLEKIRRLAETADWVEYRILIPGEKSETLERMAGVRLADKEDVAAEMLLEKIRQAECGPA